MQCIIICVDKIHLHSQSVKYRTVGKRAMSYTTKEYTKFKEEIGKEVKKQYTGVCSSDPCCLEITFTYKVPNSYSKAKKLETYGSYKESSPDVDNLCKSLLDALTGILYEDDKQVVKLTTSKKYGDEFQEKPIIIEIKKR